MMVVMVCILFFFFFSSRRRHTRLQGDWSSDVCSSDLILFFKESKDDRGLVLCKTNSRLIAGIYGVDTDDWIGERVTLFPARVEAFGETVDAIRIRPTAPGKSAKAGVFVEPPAAPAPEAPAAAEVHEVGPSDYPEGSEA